MNFTLEMDKMDAALEAAKVDVTLASKLYEQLTIVQNFTQVENPTKLEKGFAEDSLQEVNRLVGMEVFALEALSMDNAKDMGRKAIRAISEFIKRLWAIISGFFKAEDKKSEAQTERITNSFQEFQDLITASDEAIRNLNLTPGMKPNAEEKEAIANAETMILVTTDGNIADRQLIERDVTILLAKKATKSQHLAYLSNEKGDIGDLVGNVQGAVDALNANTALGYNVALHQLGENLLHVSEYSHISWIRNEGVDNCRDHVVNVIQTNRLRPTRSSKDIYQGRPFMQRWYPTFTKRKLGAAEYFSFDISASEGKLDKSPRPPKSYKLSVITMSDVEKLIDLRTKLLGFVDLMANRANEASELLNQYGVADGKEIIEAMERVVNVVDTKDQNIIREVNRMVRGFPKAMAESNSIFVNSAKAASELASNLGYYIEAMIKVELPNAG